MWECRYLFKLVLLSSSHKCTAAKLPDHTVDLFFDILRNLHGGFSVCSAHMGCTRLRSRQQRTTFPFSPHPCPHFLLLVFILVRTGMRWYPKLILILISCIINPVEHLFICLLVVHIFWRNVYSNTSPTFKLGCLFRLKVFFIYSRYSSLLDIYNEMRIFSSILQVVFLLS